MIAALGLLSLLLVGAGAVPKHPKGVVESLSVDNGLDRGEWGPVEICPTDSYAFAFEIKYSGIGFLDDTCVNAIRLFCQDSSNTLTGVIESVEGSFGQWNGMRTCPGGEYLDGFSTNVVPDMGIIGDDLGMDNIKMKCSGGSVLDGLYGLLGMRHNPLVTRELTHLNGREVEAVHMKIVKSAHARDLGEWGSWSYCTTGNKICGLQVRLEDDHVADDDAGVTDAIMYCCT